MHKVNFKLHRCICGRLVSKDVMFNRAAVYFFFVVITFLCALCLWREVVKSKLLMFTCRIIAKKKKLGHLP